MGCAPRKGPEECKTKYDRALDQCEKRADEGRAKVEQMKKACEMIQNPDQKERCMQRVEKEKEAQQEKTEQCKDEAEKQKEGCKQK